MAQGFEFVRTGNERLWVKTPFPVALNVWSSFVFNIFPEFQVPPENNYQDRHNGKYLNRQNEFDEIADGQVLGYVHAYLPHLRERKIGRVEFDGLIHVPDKRILYLDQIQADLEENPRQRRAQLEGLRQVHSELVGYLLNQLIDVPKNCRAKTTKELRDTFGKNLAQNGLLTGYFTDYGEKDWISTGSLDVIPIGKLPLYMRGQDLDFLRSQTCLDFLRDLDSVLEKDRELTFADTLQIPGVMAQKYSRIVRV